MVVICLPAASLTEMPQERIATPSIWTVQAPHCAMPQPYLVPVSPTFSRIAHNSGVSGSTSTSIVLPLMVRLATVLLPVSPLDPPHMSALRSGVDGGPEHGIVQIKNSRLRCS